jgi:hypothetical protein
MSSENAAVRLSALQPQDSFLLPLQNGRQYIRDDIVLSHREKVSGNAMLALTFNEIACEIGSGMFYWMPTVNDLPYTSIRGGVKMVYSCRPDLLYLLYDWSEEEKSNYRARTPYER